MLEEIKEQVKALEAQISEKAAARQKLREEQGDLQRKMSDLLRRMKLSAAAERIAKNLGADVKVQMISPEGTPSEEAIGKIGVG